MTNRDIFNAAVYLAGETVPAGNADYEIRSASLLALIYTECAALDAAYRSANGLDADEQTPRVSVSLSDPFPLCEVFSAPAAYALAALLTLDENAELSKTMDLRFSSLIEQIRRGIPAATEPITDIYRLF